MLDLEHEEREGVIVLHFFGSMDTGTSPQAEKYINKLVDDGGTNIVMDFAELDFISSTGLRVILATGKKLASADGKLTICSTNFTVNDVLNMSGFNKMFGVFATEDEALKSY